MSALSCSQFRKFALSGLFQDIDKREKLARVIFLKQDRMCVFNCAAKHSKHQDRAGLKLPTVD